MCHLTLFSWLSTNERRTVTRFVLRMPLTTLNQPSLRRITRSRRKKGGYCREHVGTMVVPEVSPARTCMLGRFPVVLRVCSPGRTYRKPRQLLAYIPRLNSVKRVPSEPLPPERPRVAIPLSHRDKYLCYAPCVIFKQCQQVSPMSISTLKTVFKSAFKSG